MGKFNTIYREYNLIQYTVWNLYNMKENSTQEENTGKKKKTQSLNNTESGSTVFACASASSLLPSNTGILGTRYCILFEQLRMS